MEESRCVTGVVKGLCSSDVGLNYTHNSEGLTRLFYFNVPKRLLTGCSFSVTFLVDTLLPKMPFCQIFFNRYMWKGTKNVMP